MTSTTPSRRLSGTITVSAAIIISFLLIIILKAGLLFVALRSLATAAALAFTSAPTLKSIFSTELAEFWIGALYMLLIPLIATAILIRKTTQPTKQTPKQASPGAMSFKAFLRQRVAITASGIIFILYSAAFLAPFIAPFNPYDQQDYLVTAYRAPFTTITALRLNSTTGLTIPRLPGQSHTATLANRLIDDRQQLAHRLEPKAVRYVDSYTITNDTVTYQQGMRTKTMPRTELADPTGHNSATTRLFLLGTDQYGRDILSRMIYGSRISLSIGFLVVLISVTLGTIIGVTSGFFGGWIDAIMMRTVDVLIAFPALFLILIIIATFGSSIYLIVITLSFTGWMGVARIVRSQVLSLKEQEFILAARSLGLSGMRIIFRHLAPNTLTPVIIAATLRIGSIILTEAGLSFLGLGVQPPTPSWGNIINEGRDSLLNYWWISTFPGIAILTTVICFNLIGDGVRDALDPRMRS